MAQAAGEMRYEAAAKLRDLISAVEQVTSQQTVVTEKPEALDAVALALAQDLASVTVFLVREGRLIGQNHFMLEGISGLEEKTVLEEFVKAHYQRTGAVPPKVLLATEIDDRESVRQLLEEKRGGRVSITVPQRGKKRELVTLAEENARHYLTEALGKEGSARRRAEEALLELRSALQLPVLPQRIECYDISNLFGQQAVGSMVVFEAGQAKKADYRRFKIRRTEGQPDDYAMIGEVLERRLRAGLAGQERFLPLPDLILVDGGKGQLNVALRVLREMGLKIPALGLAKEFEELFIEGRAEAVVLPRNSRPLHLLQAIRDEAHRFAVAYHRTLREKAATASILETIPGIGKKRREILLKTFGSLEGIRRAQPEAVAATPGMTKAAAEALLTNLRAAPGEKHEN
jgi:excinuclease ABC subunit C